jgi:hypothetical protein
VELRGMTGLDRSLRALVGSRPVPLDAAVPGWGGVALRLDGPEPRLERTLQVAVRVDGRLIGPGCDLLAGDVIELVASGLRLEVG